MRAPVAAHRGLIVLLMVLAPARAGAQPAADVDRAKASFNAGATAYAAGEYLAAIQAFETAYQLTPLPPIAFSLAQAHRRQYFADHDRVHLDKAIALYRGYVAEVQSGGRRADALDALSQLEPLAAVAGAGAASAPEPAARPTRVLITAEVPGAQLSLDHSPPAPSPLIREVTAGRHQVSASAPGFFPVEREVTAIAGELVPISLTLRERPSNVELSIPRDGEIYVDGTFASRGGERVSLALSGGAHQLVVARTGYRLFSQAIHLRPGEARRVEVTLEPTRTRKVSTALLIGSGVAATFAVVAAALAFEAQDDAKDFLNEQSMGNVSSAALAAYDESLSARNRYRTAAGVGLGAAFVLAGTGLLLRALDRPDVKELFEPGRPPAGSAPPAPLAVDRTRVRLIPLLAPGAVGASLGRAF
jgi:hypothetical protein